MKQVELGSVVSSPSGVPGGSSSGRKQISVLLKRQIMFLVRIFVVN